MLNQLDQDNAIQLLIFLLPPCNSDTLKRLLRLLSTVASHAEDSLDKDGNEVKEIVTSAVTLISLCYGVSHSTYDP